MKGDRVKVIIQTGDVVAEHSIVAETNGSSVTWSSDRQWVTLEQLSKANKVMRTMKFKPEVVVAVVEEPAKPV